MNIEKIFTNDKFAILSILYDKKDKDNLIHITQQELAEEVCLSRATINTIFKILKENGFLEHDTKHIGRYYLTTEAIKVIETFRELERGKSSKPSSIR